MRGWTGYFALGAGIVDRSRLFKIGLGLLTMNAISGFLMVTWFAEDALGTPITRTGIGHIVLAGISSAAVVGTAFVYGVAFRRSESLRPLSWFSIAVGAGFVILGPVAAAAVATKSHLAGAEDAVARPLLSSSLMHSAVSEAQVFPPSVSPSSRFRAKFMREVSQLGLPRGPGREEPVTEADLVPLPRTARRYLRFMGVVGRARVWSFRAGASGVFRRRPDQPWMACEAWQYNTRLDVARIFHMRMRYVGIPLLVRDIYLRGEGRMVAKLFDALPIVNEADDKIATGELVTYLNDAILLAPSMALGPEVAWREVDDGSFDLTLTDRGRKVEARVFVDDRGAVTDFSTTDRFGEDPAHPGEMVRARWTTPVQGWSLSSDQPRPTGASAVWHFPSGDLEYARFKFAEIEVNVPLAR